MHRWAKNSDKEAIMKLWAMDFESYEPYYSWYFNTVYSPKHTLCDFEGDTLAAALQLAPYSLCLRGQELPVCYVVGVITAPAFRKQGRGQALLTHAHQHLRQQGYAASLLYTDIPGFYQPLGYSHCYWQQTLCLPLGCSQSNPPSPLQAGNMPLTERADLQAHIGKLAEIYEKMTARYDGYIRRGERNWRVYLGEQSCDGAKLLLWPGRAYVLYTLSKEQLHLIELGFSDEEAVVAALSAAAQAAREARAPRLLWHGPVDAPNLLPGLPAQYWAKRPFVMARPSGNMPALTQPLFAAGEKTGAAKPLWINEYT